MQQMPSLSATSTGQMIVVIIITFIITIITIMIIIMITMMMMMAQVGRSANAIVICNPPSRTLMNDSETGPPQPPRDDDYQCHCDDDYKDGNDVKKLDFTRRAFIHI